MCSIIVGQCPAYISTLISPAYVQLQGKAVSHELCKLLRGKINASQKPFPTPGDAAPNSIQFLMNQP